MDQANSPIISRLAPTPSGYLHLGNLFNFVLTWLHVRRGGGQLILRIDDLDQARVRDHYLDDIFWALDWLGLEYDQGPSGAADFKTKYSQTLRVDSYDQTVETIRKRSATFYCECSRKDLQKLSSDRLYQGTCRYRNLEPADGQMVLRLATDNQSLIGIAEEGVETDSQSIHTLMPYPVLAKKDGIPTYQVASLTDDVNMRVNFLVRGKDLWTSSLTQSYLAKIGDFESFSNMRFIHHELIGGNDQLKLSKSQNAPSYERTQLNKARLVTMVGKSLGLTSAISNLEELLNEACDKL